ncbi:MAG: hypothetical protein IT378_16260 [Sandaracinaceae bacterium]|nr:hypothetical protein [Sandaracinaceae bacterium]
MSKNEKLQLQYDQLIAGFVAPLVAGGTVVVDQPMAPGAIEYFQHAKCGDSMADTTIYDALHRGASAIAPVQSVPWPERDAILLAMAAHDLVMLTDPALDRLFARGARARIVRWIDEILELVALPSTRAEALARHALVEPVPVLRRKDVVAKSWAYTYRYHGRPLPSNVFQRPLVGDFRKSETLLDVVDLIESLDATTGLSLKTRLRALLSRSPVTELVRPDLCPDLRFSLGTFAVLSDDAIRGGVASALVERGEWRCAPVLGRALGEPALMLAEPDLVWYALALCFEVHMTAELDTPGPSWPDRLDLTDPDVARFAAVLPAMFEDESMLDEVRSFDDADRAEVQERCARLTKLVPEAIRVQVGELVARAERPHRILPTTSSVEIRP